MATRGKGAMSDKDLRELLQGLSAQLNEMKAGQDRLEKEMKAGQEEMKARQEEMKAGQEEMKAGQDRLEKEMKASQEGIKQDLASVKSIVEEKISAMEERISGVEENVSKIEENVEEKFSRIDVEVHEVKENISKITGNFSKIMEKVETIDDNIDQKIEKNMERKIQEKLGDKIEENLDKQIQGKLEFRMGEKVTKLEEKFLKIEEKLDQLDREVSTQSIKDQNRFENQPNRACVKLSTYDGKTSWQVYKTQFAIVAEANGWDSSVKAFQLAAALRGDAADVLQTLPEHQRMDFAALSSALELRFGEQCMKDYSRLQLKSRFQKVGESLQEFAADIERLSISAYPDCPAGARDNFALEFFIDGLRDSEIKKSLRMADVKDLKSALVYALKCEAAQQASRNRQSVRVTRINEQDAELEELKRCMKELSGELRKIQNRTSNQNKQIRCWSCGGENHVRRNCPARAAERRSPTTQEGN